MRCLPSRTLLLTSFREGGTLHNAHGNSSRDTFVGVQRVMMLDGCR